MEAAPQTPPRTAYAGIFLVSAATLLLQVVFTRIFSVSIWYHFAFLVVSVALFGFGASGVVLALVPAGARDAFRCTWTPALFGACALLAYLGTNAVPFSPFRMLRAPLEIVYFLLYDLLLAAPFFFAGATVLLLLRRYPERTGALYACDLVGAAIGTLLVFAALPALGAAGAVVLAAALGFAAAACLATARARAGLAAVAALLLALLLVPRRLPEVRIDSSKALAAEVGRGGRITFSAWNALSRIDVVEHPNVEPMLLIDAAAMSPLAAPRDPGGVAVREVSTLGLRLHSAPAVLIIGSGGGIDVQNALALGARAVTCVEINPTIVRLVTGPYHDRIGDVFSDPRVQLVQDEGRSFIERSRARYDIIQITLIDTWAASVSGAYSLSENYLYTVEAFRSYLEHLEPDGMLAITRWGYEAPRLVSLGRAALESLGVGEPWRHVLLVRDRLRAVFLLKCEPFTAAEVQAARTFAAQTGAEVLHDPTAAAGAEPPRSVYAALLSPMSPQDLFDAAPVALRPVGDDNPFFFQMGRWSRLDLGALRKFSGGNALEPLVLPAGQIALLAALVLALFLSAVLLAIPLARRAVPAGGRARWLSYFFALGLGYITVEVVLMQRFALFLGHPTYSVTTVLFTLLLFSGLGSAWLGGRRDATRSRLLWTLPVGILLLAFAAPPILHALIGLPFAARIAFAVACIAPLGLLMGAPFPLGAQAAVAADPAYLPWAWAANGCASVIGSVCAVLGAMAWNFSTVLALAAAVYAGAVWALRAAGPVRRQAARATTAIRAPRR